MGGGADRRGTVDSVVRIGDLGLRLTSLSPSRKGMIIILNTNNSATKRSLIEHDSMLLAVFLPFS